MPDVDPTQRLVMLHGYALGPPYQWASLRAAPPAIPAQLHHTAIHERQQVWAAEGSSPELRQAPTYLLSLHQE